MGLQSVVYQEGLVQGQQRHTCLSLGVCVPLVKGQINRLTDQGQENPKDNVMVSGDAHSGLSLSIFARVRLPLSPGRG